MLRFYNKNKRGTLKVSHDGIGTRVEGIRFLKSSDFCKEDRCTARVYKKGYCRGHLGIKVAISIQKDNK